MIPRTEERTPRTSPTMNVSNSEMEGREDVESRANDDLSSEYEPTDMSDESELQDAEEVGKDEANDTCEVEVLSSTTSDEQGGGALR